MTSRTLFVFASAFILPAGAAFGQVQRGTDLDAPEPAASRYGHSVSMPDDNTLAVAGPWLGEHGGVAVEVWDGTAWELKGDVVLAPADWVGLSNWGEIVSMPDVNTFAASTQVLYVVDSAPRTVVVEWNGAAWVQKGDVLSGLSVDMADADHLVLFQENASTGTVHPVALEWNGTDWQAYGAFPEDLVLEWGEHGRLAMPDPQTVAVGLPQTGSNQGSVAVFNLMGQTWTQAGETLEGEENQDYFGWSICMPDAHTLAVGARGASSACVFTYDGTGWNQKGNTISGFFTHQYGYSVSMPDADHIAVGGPDSEGDNGLWPECGGVRVFQFNYAPGWSNSTWVTQNHPTLHGEGPGNLWGISVSMPSPNVVAGGAPGNYGPDGTSIEAAGHARVYDLNFPPLANTAVTAPSSPTATAIHPNPTRGTVCLTEVRNGWAHWYSATGTLLSSAPAQPCYDLSGYGHGMYLLKLETANGLETHRVLVLP